MLLVIPQKSLLINRKVLRLRKAFANNSSANTKNRKLHYLRLFN